MSDSGKDIDPGPAPQLGRLAIKRRSVALATFGKYLERTWIRQDLDLLRSRGFDAYGLALPYRYPTPMDLLWLLRNLGRLLKSDIVLVWFAFPGPVLVSRIFGKPVVTNAVGYEVAMHKWLDYGEPLNPFARVLVALALKYSDRTVAISRESAAWASKLGARNPEVVYEAVDSRKFSPGPTRASKPGPGIVTVSLLSEGDVRRKDLVTLLQAYARLRANSPAARLTVIGSKLEGYPALLKETEVLGVKAGVEFTGYLEFPEMLERLRGADEFVLPSLHEGFPTVLCEAALCGIPVVTTDLPAMNEVFVHGENALLVPPRNPERLEDAMATLLSDGALAARIASRGRSDVLGRFSLERRGEGLEGALARASDDPHVRRRAPFNPGLFILYLGLTVVASGWVALRRLGRMVRG